MFLILEEKLFDLGDDYDTLEDSKLYLLVKFVQKFVVDIDYEHENFEYFERENFEYFVVINNFLELKRTFVVLQELLEKMLEVIAFQLVIKLMRLQEIVIVKIVIVIAVSLFVEIALQIENYFAILVIALKSMIKDYYYFLEI